MQSTTSPFALTRVRLALGITALASVLLLTSGCALAARVAESAASRTSASAFPTAEASIPTDGWRYEDDTVGYAITFPGKFDVAPIQGAAEGAMKATYSTTSIESAPNGIYYSAGASVNSDATVDRETLEGGLMHLIVSGGSITTPKDVDLDGVPGLTSDLAGPDGKEMTVTLAGKGHTFYQFIVIGGTHEDRQDFIDTFEKLD